MRDDDQNVPESWAHHATVVYTNTGLMNGEPGISLSNLVHPCCEFIIEPP